MTMLTVLLFLRFVGVGARRVRALFQAAKKKVILIYFILLQTNIWHLQLYLILTFSILFLGSLHCFH